MKTVKVKTSELIGRALDWAVGDSEFKRLIAEGAHVKQWVLDQHNEGSHTDPYSTDWLFGGPIIESEEIAVQCCYTGGELSGWLADSKLLSPDDEQGQFGSIPLIAAMRCYVASKLGAEVEVPDQLGKT